MKPYTLGYRQKSFERQRKGIGSQNSLRFRFLNGDAFLRDSLIVMPSTLRPDVLRPWTPRLRPKALERLGVSKRNVVIRKVMYALYFIRGIPEAIKVQTIPMGFR